MIVLSMALPSGDRQRMTTLLRHYTDAVTAKEFPSMASRESSPDAEVAFQALWLGATLLSQGAVVQDRIPTC